MFLESVTGFLFAAMGKNRLQADLELVPDPRLALAQESALDAGHVKKRKRRNKGRTVSFDVDELK